jgi:hypothetical protein
VGWFKIRSFLFTFNRLLALNEFQRVFLVLRELVNSLVVASLRRVRRLESFIVQGNMGRWVLTLEGLLEFWKGAIGTKDLLNRIESILLAGNLRESFLLNFAFMFKALLGEKLTPVIKRISHVRKIASKASLLSDFTFLRRVGKEVSRLSDHSAVITSLWLFLLDVI